MCGTLPKLSVSREHSQKLKARTLIQYQKSPVKISLVSNLMKRKFAASPRTAAADTAKSKEVGNDDGARLSCSCRVAGLKLPALPLKHSPPLKWFFQMIVTARRLGNAHAKAT